VTPADLSVRRLSRRFGRRLVLDGLSLEVTRGRLVVLIGPSGCGKTTLLRVIAGLDLPDAGEVWIAGRQVAAAGRNMVPPNQRQIGFVFQDLALWPHMTVEQQLDFVLASGGIPRPARPARTRAVLALARIEPLAGRRPHELSGGEQQRAALARALVGGPQLLLMDEPFSSLDADLRAAVRTDFRRLQRQAHVTTLFVTHDREDAAALADDVIEMRDGRLSDTTRPAASEGHP
jgi:iron(III) transport system ATP-binding protein